MRAGDVEWKDRAVRARREGVRGGEGWGDEGGASGGRETGREDDRPRMETGGRRGDSERVLIVSKGLFGFHRKKLIEFDRF